MIAFRNLTGSSKVHSDGTVCGHLYKANGCATWTGLNVTRYQRPVIITQWLWVSVLIAAQVVSFHQILLYDLDISIAEVSSLVVQMPSLRVYVTQNVSYLNVEIRCTLSCCPRCREWKKETFYSQKALKLIWSYLQDNAVTLHYNFL